jgi:hypothetical protein
MNEKEIAKLHKGETEKLRGIVLKLLREHAKNGGSIGMADAETLTGLANSLEKDSSQWFAAGMQLFQVGFISYKHFEILTGKYKKKVRL